MESFVRERSEWCISRQRVWGTPIPSLHDTKTGDAILTAESIEHILSILELKGVSYWWDGPVEEFLTPSLRAAYPDRTWVKGTDTIDVWFDSGSSWTRMRDVEGSEAEVHQGLRVADVSIEGTDQHRGWFQSLLLTAVGSTPEGAAPRAPYKDLITHGFVLDEKGKKMSKSEGNIMSPKAILEGSKVYNSSFWPLYMR